MSAVSLKLRQKGEWNRGALPPYFLRIVSNSRAQKVFAVSNNYEDPVVAMENTVEFFKTSSSEVKIYKPVTDGSHRKLGVTLEGMYYFLEEIGFIEWKLPEMWSLSMVEKTGKIPVNGLAVQITDREHNCKFCRETVMIGETAIVDLDELRMSQEEGHVGGAARHSAYARHLTCQDREIEKGKGKRCEYGNSTGWRYVDTYTRSESLSRWFSGPCPEIDYVNGSSDCSPGMKNMTGYDLVSFVQNWLAQEGLSHLSLAEVMLTEDRFIHLREHVGIASVFWSHIDSEPVIDHCEGTLVRIREAREKYAIQLPHRSEQFWWVDYFSLRQGIGGDFEMESIIDLIKSIKNVVCSIQDKEGSVKTYLSRSFCLFEMFSALSEDMNLICYGNRVHRSVLESQLAPECPQGWINWWPQKRWAGPVDAAQAQTSHRHDKQKIDNYIQDLFGFEDFNAKITQALLRGASCDAHRRQDCITCPIVCYSQPCKNHQMMYCPSCMSTFNFIGINAIECKEHKQCCCASCY